MKRLAREIGRRFVDLHDDPKAAYYYKVYVDRTDEAREVAKDRWCAVRGLNPTFRTLALYGSEDEAYAAMLRRLSEMCQVALSMGYAPVGEITEMQEEFHEWWAYADFANGDVPIRIWAQLAPVATL